MLGCFSLQLVRNVYSLSKFLLNKKKKVDLQQKKKTLKLLCCWGVQVRQRHEDGIMINIYVTVSARIHQSITSAPLCKGVGAER